MTNDTHPASAPAWHNLDAGAVLTALDVDGGGLSAFAVAQRRAHFGPNTLPAPPRRPALRRFLAQFHNVLIYVLIGAAAVTTALGHLADSGVIAAVVVINAVIGYLQEGKAEQAMDAIRHLLAPSASALRDGVRVSVPGATLVPGDIVLLEAGDRVPADLRLLESRGLRVQEAMLTGESVAVEKGSAAVVADAPLGDRSCLAFSGTLVVTGQGRGVVVATGRTTEIGRISGLIAGVEELATPLTTQMAAFARWLTALILAFSGLLLAHGHYVLGYPFDELFMIVVGLAVAAIPEGLPAVLTITLAIGVQAMARRHAVVRRLPAIETVGAVSVICSDKTGTLTANKMTAASALCADGNWTVEGTGYAPHGALRREDGATTATASLRELARAALLCNDAALGERDGEWQVEGDPMEGALLAFAGKCGLDRDGERRAWRRTDVIPFDARHRYMATLDHDHEGQACAFVKGAPESILAMCALECRADRSSQVLRREHWRQAAEDIAAAGQRVLAFAMLPLPPSEVVLEARALEGRLILLGLVGLIDPPRAEAVAAVAECHRAGIQVKMITGDHAGTAAAIGRQIGLRHADRVLTGSDIDALDDGALARVVEEIDIYARTSPEHKLRLVSALQARRHVVAMTGDGVNDAPALKRADAGIAMGRGGSEAAKEASALVLADDNFASIVAAVREGRTVYDNLKKVISWTLPTNAGEAMTIVTALLFGLSLPVTAVQILWVNLVTATTLGVALAFEPTEPGTMERPPRQRGAPLLDGALVWHIVLVSVLIAAGVFGVYRHALAGGAEPALARTMAVNTLVVMEMFHLFFIRNIHGTSFTWRAVRGTRVVWLTVVAVTLAQLAFTYLPWMQGVFGSVAVPFVDGLVVIGAGVALFAVIELEKKLRLLLRALPAPP